MNPLLRHAYRVATWVLVVVVLASSLAAVQGVARAATTNYVLTGYVDQPGLSAPPVPAGVTVDLVSRATGAVFTSVVSGSGGQFTFTSAGTSGALSPGYWAVFVPAAANVSLVGCKPCGVLPAVQNPVYQYINGTQLTNATYSTAVHGVSILPYNATLNGTVTQNSSTIQGASVRLLAPTYNGLVLINNTTNASGKFSLKVPFGTWVLQVTHVSGPNVYSNTSSITIASRTPAPVAPVLHSFEVSGHILSNATGLPVSTSGNATLFDPANGFVYSTPTVPGGFYAFSTYPSNFVSGNGTFDVIAASTGFSTGWSEQNVSGASSLITFNPSLSAMTPAQQGSFATTLDLSSVNVTTGHGSIGVSTDVRLGNDSILPGLPNASVGQLWAQLGLDFNHSLSFPAADVPALQAWVNASGPFFPAVQALTTVNGTGLVDPRVAQLPSAFTAPSCSTPCGLSSSAVLSYAWNTSYALNGTLPKNASSYTLSFRFAHPSSTADVYNYTVKLPGGYVLSAGSNAPSHSKLVGTGPSGTWTTFTLVSQPSATAAATATFSLVRAANLTAIVNVSSKEFTFSKANVPNSTRDGYTVILGVDQNATFSAANSTFPAGTNGTSFQWNFGDGNTTTVTNLSTNHSYSGPNGSSTWNGTLTIVSSGGQRNATHFFVWVVSSVPTPVISSNAAAKFVHTGYLQFPWNTTVQFNATNSTVAGHNNLSIALFKLTAKNFNATRNNSVAAGGRVGANWSVAFGGGSKPGAGAYVNFSNVTINSAHLPGASGWGWIYNLTLTVYSCVGTSAVAKLVILVNDSQAPVPSITLQGPSGNTIGSNGIVEGPSHTATVRLNASGSTDPGNGSIVKYRWQINLKGNASFLYNQTYTSVKPGGSLPNVTLAPANKTYRVNLTVWDKAGNSKNVSKTLLVSKNSTTRPIMQASNLTGPSSVNVGTSYTYWVNVTVGGGVQSNATNVSVTFYLKSASGTGSKTVIAGTPASVVFYGYSNNSTTNATLNSTPLPSTNGVLSSPLPYGQIVRAQISWSPGSSGSFVLYANVTASNEFSGDFGSTNIASTPVTVKQNPVTQTIEYVVIAVVVVAILAGLYLFYRRRTRRPAGSKPSTGRGGLERGKTTSDEEDDES